MFMSYRQNFAATNVFVTTTVVGLGLPLPLKWVLLTIRLRITQSRILSHMNERNSPYKAWTYDGNDINSCQLTIVPLNRTIFL